MMSDDPAHIDLHAMDVWISGIEGGAVNLPIAQISEVRRLALVHLGHIIAEHHDGAESVLAACRHAHAVYIGGNSDDPT